MTPSLTLALLLHIMFGIVAVIGAYGAWMSLLRKESRIGSLKIFSALSFFSFMLSWLAGGYYYLVYYGANVKPLIIKGKYSWAHTVIMEAKEHIFIFLPFLALILLCGIIVFGDTVNSDPRLKRPLVVIAGIITVLGIAITLSGMAISGAVR